jgi:hypothetical protein
VHTFKRFEMEIAIIGSGKVGKEVAAAALRNGSA